MFIGLAKLLVICWRHTLNSLLTDVLDVKQLYVGCEWVGMLAIYHWHIGKHVGQHVGGCFAGVGFVTLPIEGCETFQNHLKESVENN